MQDLAESYRGRLQMEADPEVRHADSSEQWNKPGCFLAFLAVFAFSSFFITWQLTSFLVAVFCLVLASRFRKAARQIEHTPSLDVASLRPGMAEVRGRLMAAPGNSSALTWFSNTECVAFHSQVYSRSDNAEVVAWSHNHEPRQIAVADSTGIVLINREAIQSSEPKLCSEKLSKRARIEETGLLANEEVVVNGPVYHHHGQLVFGHPEADNETDSEGSKNGCSGCSGCLSAPAWQPDESVLIRTQPRAMELDRLRSRAKKTTAVGLVLLAISLVAIGLAVNRNLHENCSNGSCQWGSSTVEPLQTHGAHSS